MTESKMYEHEETCCGNLDEVIFYTKNKFPDNINTTLLKEHQKLSDKLDELERLLIQLQYKQCSCGTEEKEQPRIDILLYSYPRDEKTFEPYKLDLE